MSYDTESVAEENERRLTMMVKFGLTSAQWDCSGLLERAERPATPARAPASATAPPPPPGVAKRVADAFAGRLRHDHDVRFAHSHYRPRFDEPAPPASDVPRAVKARAESSHGRTSSNKRNR